MLLNNAAKLLIAFLMLGLPRAYAADVPPESFGRFQNWTVYAATENNQPVCYMKSSTLLSKSAIKKRTAPYVVITHRPAENMLDVVHVNIGVELAPDAEALLQVDKKTFRMFTDKTFIWARDALTDRAIVTAIKGGKGLAVKAPTLKGAVLLDSYSLSGAAAAYKKLNQICGVN
jgi:hypothetical protein